MLDVDVLTQLVPNPLTMLATLCSTFVLFMLARKFLWKSVKDYMGKRADKMQADLAETEKAKKEAFEDRKKAMEQLNAAAGKADEIVQTAIKDAKNEKESILAEASRQADAARKKAHEQIEAERQSMYDGMRREMVNIAMDAAGRLISSKDKDEMDRQAVDAFVKEASGNEE